MLYSQDSRQQDTDVVQAENRPVKEQRCLSLLNIGFGYGIPSKCQNVYIGL